MGPREDMELGHILGKKFKSRSFSERITNPISSIPLPALSASYFRLLSPGYFLYLAFTLRDESKQSLSYTLLAELVVPAVLGTTAAAVDSVLVVPSAFDDGVPLGALGTIGFALGHALVSIVG